MNTGLATGKVWIILLSLGILLIVGCATLNEKKQLASLEETTEAYGLAIRWGYYKIADGYQKTEDNPDQTADLKDLKKIKITSYEPLSIKISDDRLSARQTVEIKYYNIDQLIENTIVDEQLWRYDTDDEKWYLHSGLPDFK